MLGTCRSKKAQILAALLLAGLTLAAGPRAMASCQPGQMQEANLAYNKAAEFLTAQQWDLAIAGMNSAIQICPEHVEANRGLATAYFGKEDFVKASEYYQTVIRLRADEVEAGDFGNLGKTYAKLKMYKEARAEYMKAEQLAPDDCGVLFNLGVLHMASGYNTQSVEVFEHALDVCPQLEGNILPQLAKAATKASEQQRKNGNNAEADRFHTLAVKYGSQAGGSTTYALATQRFNERNYAEAASLLNQILEKDPGHTGALLTLARAQDQLGNKAASIDAYKRYLALKPKDSVNAGEMIRVMVEAGQCSQAAAEAGRIAQGLESMGREAMAPVLYGWGTALECAGDFTQAKSKFQQCASSGHPRFAGSARTMIERMDGLMEQAEYQRKKAAQGG